MKTFLLLLAPLPSISMAASNVVKDLESFWIEPNDILNSLDEYKAIWVKPHGCVWSECAVDDTDDSVVGDNRDGDEQWYQYRTQEFCANAAYSLYGAKAGEIGLFGCTGGHFINSFFTYGGADNLLKAVGMTPIVYYGGNDGNGNNNNGNSQNTNAMCQEIDSDGNGGGNQEEEHQSGDQENQLVSSLGCNAQGQYIIAKFQASNCDGNYFSGVVDSFEDYNQQHSSVGCHRIWERRDNAYSLSLLLNNSWSCDLDLYPNGCPDPYHKKERWDFALRTVSHGGNAQWAYRNMEYKSPLRILSFVFAALAFTVIAFGYYIKNRDRVASKGGKFRGYFRCLWEDFCEQVVIAKEAIVRCVRSQVDDGDDGKEYDTSSPRMADVRIGKSKKKKSKKKKKKKGTSEEDPEDVLV